MLDAKGESPIFSDILRGRRQYFIDKVKAPLYEGLVGINRSGFFSKLFLLWDIWNIVTGILRYPEPTMENTKKRMSHILLDIFDEFEKYNTIKPPMFRVLRRLIVCTVEHDKDYSQRLTWFLEKLAQSYLGKEWPQLEDWAPMSRWSDPTTQKAVKLAREEFRKGLTVGGRNIGDIET